ncbi:MAG TPA: class I SAM-dependent methyltransferase [Stellaceae bacterium]|nr:class I SAM-dependent methyltransferase [Stellaceae bacterium]
MKTITAMSPPVSTKSEALPRFMLELLGLARAPREGEEIVAHGQKLVLRDGILRGAHAASAEQAHTSGVFGFKWQQRESFESPASLARMRQWLIERYGNPRESSWLDGGARPLVVDAGCGAGMSALELFDGVFDRMHYIGTDISAAVDVARDRFGERGISAGFIQADLHALPFARGSLDVIFSEGVLHHTDSTERALAHLATLLKPGGRLLFYVYRKKGPIREFADDYVRAKLRALPPEAAWQALRPLTELGIALGKLGATIELKEPIDILEIPAGPIDVQRLFYWHVLKAFYRADLTFDEMHHINFDWYAPENAHRQSPEEVRRWCADAGLAIERERIEESGITIVAQKKGDGIARR